MGRPALVLSTATACALLAAGAVRARPEPAAAPGAEAGGQDAATSPDAGPQAHPDAGPAAAGTREASEEIVVIGRLPQLPLPPSRIPASVHVLDAGKLQRAGNPTLPELLASQVPALSLSDEQGNSYQPDLLLRGFQATSVTGVPQGVSVFLDGVRVNEPTAEEINFDLLPTDDLERIEVIPGPSVLFGRNTLGGAINLVTRRGGEEGAAAAEASAGSAGFRRIRGSLSGRAGPADLYLSGTGTHEDGWRDATGARLGKLFVKAGLRGGESDAALSYQHVDNRIEQAGPLPASELARDRSANYTPGDFFAPRLDQLALNARHDFGELFTLSANGFGRLLHVEQFNVNLAGDNSRLFSRTGSAGGTIQLDRAAPLLGRSNVLTAGIEYAHSAVEVSVFNESSDGTARNLETHVRDGQDTFAAYVQDTFQITRGLLGERDELVLTAAARWDLIRHEITDHSPPAAGRENASGVYVFRRLDPLVGLNYNPSRDLGFYLSWSQGFRAPALLELTCSGPAAICPGLQAGTAPDPSLKPVRATNLEIGLRARLLPWLSGQLSGYWTEVFDDIFAVSPVGTTGVYFQNIGRTRRQGLEVALRGKPDFWLEASLGYALTFARFEDEVSLATPRAVPGCDGATCTERVPAGSEFPLVPRHRASAGLDFRPLRWLSLSLSGIFVSSQYLRGDEANTGPRLDPWFTLEGALRATAGGFSAFVRGVNIMDAQYSSFGTYARNPKLPGSPVEPFLTPGRPFQIFAGVGYGLGTATSGDH
ncbi:MAG TPA: TonB-dependent receptor [Myxococcales bacterium]|nr:TonB-dependent receptor [Myxococcales bacterium]